MFSALRSSIARRVVATTTTTTAAPSALFTSSASSSASAAVAAATTQHQQQQQCRQFSNITLPDLPYDYSALEPYVSAEIMQIHHQKHHQTYVNNMNVVATQLADAVDAVDVGQQIALEAALKFNGGGHLNHSLFWENLASASGDGGGDPSGQLLQDIESKWGSMEHFRHAFSTATVAVQGSGWGWLTFSDANGLMIETRANQDPVVGSSKPLLGVDVWEHAYYLQYQNVRPEYVSAIWNIINWKTVGERYSAAIRSAK